MDVYILHWRAPNTLRLRDCSEKLWFPIPGGAQGQAGWGLVKGKVSLPCQEWNEMIFIVLSNPNNFMGLWFPWFCDLAFISPHCMSVISISLSRHKRKMLLFLLGALISLIWVLHCVGHRDTSRENFPHSSVLVGEVQTTYSLQVVLL